MGITELTAALKQAMIDSGCNASWVGLDAYCQYHATAIWNNSPAGGVPGAHAATHAPGGSDPLTVDAVAATGSLRTLGTGAQQACAGNDSRLTNSRTPTPHAASHAPGGSDALTVDGIASTGSLRTLGTGAQQACSGSDARLSDARTPTAHATSHRHGGGDEISTGTPTANSIPKSGTDGKLAVAWLPTGTTSSTVCIGNDARLSDARSPTAHAASHVTGGSDVIANAVASGNAGLMTGADKAKLDGIATSATYSPLSGNTPNMVSKTAGSAGVSAYVSRADHTHEVTTAAAGSIFCGDTAAEGTATTLARSDHKHAFSIMAPEALVVGGSNVIGTASYTCRADHKHALPAFGTTAGTICQGNDSRLTQLRTTVIAPGFSWPDGPGSSCSIPMATTAGLFAGAHIQVGTAGQLQVSSVDSATQVTAFVEYEYSVSFEDAIPAGEIVQVSGAKGYDGANGANGVSPSVTLTQAFTMPAVGSTVSVTLSGYSGWIYVGQTVYVQDAGYMRVTAFSGSVTLMNLGCTGNAAPGASIAIYRIVWTSGAASPATPIAHYTKIANDALASDSTLETPCGIVLVQSTITTVKYIPAAALTANATNYASLIVYRYDSNGANKTAVASVTTGSASWTAWKPVDLSIVNQPVPAGWSLTFVIYKYGTGVIVPQGTLIVA